MKYQTKPIVINAVRWFKNGDHPDDNCEIFDAGKGPFQGEGQVVRYYRNPDDDGKRICEHCGLTLHDHGWIDTLEEGHDVCPGDWIVTGLDGEYYPVKNNIFNETYEVVAT